MHRTRSRTCAVLLSPLLALAIAATSAAATSAPTDAWITTKVKISLATSDQVSALDVNVDTIDGQVTLHGKVDSAAEKQAAEREARGVQGVRNVRNLLQVVPAEKREMVEAKDDELRTRVSSALENKTDLKQSEITVKSVNNGVVVLEGNAGNLSDKLTAVRTARAVAGVRRVQSEIETPDELADRGMWKDSDAERTANRVERKTEEAGSDLDDTAEGAADNVESAARKTGNVVSDTAGDVGSAARDLYVTSMVKTKLLAEDNTPAMDINVDTQDGVVSLFGEVPSAASKTAAERIAKDTAGVRSVRNQLQVSTAATAQDADQDAAAAGRKDEDPAAVESTLKENIEQHSQLENVNVDVKGCVAHLSGTVDSGVERVEALQLARATTGVCSVRDELTIR